MVATFICSSRRLLAFALLIGCAATVAAQSTEAGFESRSRNSATVANDPDRARANGNSPTPNDSFGTSDRSVVWLPAAEFQPRQSGTNTFAYGGIGYIYRTAGSDLIWADVRLPNGALLDTVRAWISDSSASASATLYLTRFSGNSDGFTDIASVSSTDGDTSIAFLPALVLDNSANMYVVYMGLPIDIGVQFKGVRLLWYRQVSPAPGSATFGDVPTTSGQFRFVEALVAAGITAGCGSGNYCPGDPVTRGQMAVFLSVALGLHHPF